MSYYNDPLDSGLSCPEPGDRILVYDTDYNELWRIGTYEKDEFVLFDNNTLSLLNSHAQIHILDSTNNSEDERHYEVLITETVCRAYYIYATDEKQAKELVLDGAAYDSSEESVENQVIESVQELQKR